ncbi:AAA family ATPase [Limimaricola cinnabarinus]|uniref:AAA family ATPase n=1 Tax=Limimaricola cinnabarinus TaxID=1125964 RepID=UPI002491D502|nr:AAA family ATPase [Limimaricola cinnabarinus]
MALLSSPDVASDCDGQSDASRGLLLFDWLMARKSAEAHAAAFADWHHADDAAHRQYQRTMGAYDEAVEAILGGPIDLPEVEDPGPAPVAPQEEVSFVPPCPAVIGRSPTEIAAAAAHDIDLYAVTQTYGTQVPPLSLAALEDLIDLLPLCVALAHENHFAQLFAPSAVTIIETGPGPASVQTVTAVNELARLIRTAPEEEIVLLGAMMLADMPATFPSLGSLIYDSEEGLRHRRTNRPQDALPELRRQEPLVILVDSRDQLSPQLQALGLPLVALPPLDANLLLAMLRRWRSATGYLHEAEIRRRLPTPAALAAISPDGLVYALRQSTTLAAAEMLGRQAERMQRDQGGTGPCLGDLHLPQAVHDPLVQLVADLKAWRVGDLPWTDIETGWLIWGPPGTGKTMLAAALARTAGVLLIAASYAQWQSTGHLGDMQRAARATFEEARREPNGCILFIEEVDAIGNRSAGSGDRGTAYENKVVACFLELLDGISGREGVIVVGATNLPELVDPVLRRPGRLGRILELPLPRPVQIAGMLRHHLGRDLPGLDLMPLARQAAGLSAADVAALIRQARATARAARRPIDGMDLQQALDGLRPRGCAAHRERLAIHEAGHALAHHLLGITRPTAMRLTLGGGMVEVETLVEPQTLAQLEARLQTLLAGRAAERLLLGDVSAGAGGGEGSDLAMATETAPRIETVFGLGGQGPLWIPGSAQYLVLDRALATRVRERLEVAETAAGQLLKPHLDTLRRFAYRLLVEEEIEGEALLVLLGEPVELRP